MNYQRTTNLNRIGIWLLAILPWFLFGTSAQAEEEEIWHWEVDPDYVTEEDEVQAVLFQPTGLDEHYFLFLETSEDLESWQRQAIPAHAVNEEGFLVVEGGAVSRKFWRLRIIPTARVAEDWEWPTKLSAVRKSGEIEVRLEVNTAYHPAILMTIQEAAAQPVPWGEEEGTERDRANAATQTALQRLIELAERAEFRPGDAFQIRRRIDET